MNRRMFLLLGVLLTCAFSESNAQLLINEFMAAKGTYTSDPQGEYNDWIELFNAADEDVDVAGMYLTDNLANPTKWQFPTDDAEATRIAAQGFLLVWADGDLEQPGLHTNFKLAAQGEEIALLAADGQRVLDSLVFAEQKPDIAYGRDPQDPGTWRYLAWPTPGQANMPAYRGVVADPEFSHTRGFYDDPFAITLSCDTPDAVIIYTVEGHDPLRSSGAARRQYSAPITIDKTRCVRAVATKPGWLPSKAISHTYMYRASNAVKSLPVISLVGSPGETFYAPDGIMAIVGGRYDNGVWTATTPDSYNNVMIRGLERPVSFEYLLPNDDASFQVNCGIRVHGSNWMRPRYNSNSKFSFRLYFRDDYGPDWLDYPLFPFEVDRFKSIVLRGGHNDRTNPFVKDELIRRLLKDMGHVSSGGSFATVFVNGEYQGYFNPCEHITEAFCRAWFDSDQDWDIITMFGGVREGDRVHIDALTQYVRSHDLSMAEHYAHVAQQVDIIEFIDYLILRLWSGDWDWPHNNWSAARERSPSGQWRFFVWDAEGGMFSNRLNEVDFSALHNNNHENAILYNGLYANPQFRYLFGDRLQQHFHNQGVMTEPHIRQRFAELQEEMRGVIPNMNTYVVDTWVPQRQDIFLNACQQERVFTFAGPTPFLNLAVQYGGYVQPGDLLYLLNPNATGTVYYTDNGQDPLPYDSLAPWEWTTLVPRTAEKRVLVPREDLGLSWAGSDPFDDTGWRTVSGLPGGVGYDRGSGYEDHIGLDVETDMQSHTGCYIRIPFSLAAGPADWEALSLRIQYDDGFAAYLNGALVTRRNAGTNPIWNATASASHSDAAAVVFEAIDLSDSLPLLQTGANVLAIHGLNRSTGSSDFLINAELMLGKSQAVEVPGDVMTYDSPIALTESTQIKARILRNNTWSTLTQVTFALESVKEALRITEIMFHPPDSGDLEDPNTEFIELMNTSDQTINLNLVRFTDGIYFDFPAVDVAPGALVLLVKDRDAFTGMYGPDLPVIGEYTGSLNNAGEWIELQDAARQTIHGFRYQDDWYEQTDGEGHSLIVKHPASMSPGALSDKEAWRPGRIMGGTPGRHEDTGGSD